MLSTSNHLSSKPEIFPLFSSKDVGSEKEYTRSYRFSGEEIDRYSQFGSPKEEASSFGSSKRGAAENTLPSRVAQ